MIPPALAGGGSCLVEPSSDLMLAPLLSSFGSLSFSVIFRLDRKIQVWIIRSSRIMTMLSDYPIKSDNDKGEVSDNDREKSLVTTFYE